MKKLKLKPSLQGFLLDDEELILQSNNRTFLKSKLTENYILLLVKLNSNQIIANLGAVWDKENKEIVLPFFNSVCNEVIYENTEEEIKDILLEIKQKLKDINIYIEKEFEDIIEFLEVDDDLFNDKEVLSLAEDSFKSMSPISFTYPQIPKYLSDDLFFQIKVIKDIKETAYNFMEDYLKKNPKILKEYQQKLAAKRILNEMISKASKYKQVLGKIINLLKSDTYKSLTIYFETTYHGEIVEKYKTNSLKIKSIPLYAITKIEYRKKLLFDREKEISDAEWKYNKELWEYCFENIKHFCKNNLSDTFKKCLYPEILKDEDFAYKLISINIEYLNSLCDYLPHTDSFITKLAESYSRYFYYSYNRSYSELFTEKKYAKIILQKSSLNYDSLSPELQSDFEILDISLKQNGGLVLLKENLFTKDLLTFFESKLIEYPNLVFNKISMNGFVVNNLENLQIAKNLCIAQHKILAFKKIDIDEDFIIEVIDSISSQIPNFDRFFKSLPEKYMDNENILEKLLEDFYKNSSKINPFFSHNHNLCNLINHLPKSMLNVHFVEKFIKKNENNKYFIIDLPFELVKEFLYFEKNKILANELFCIWFDRHMGLLKDESKAFVVNYLIANKNLFTDSSINFSYSLYLDLLKKDLTIFDYIPLCYINYKDIYEYLEDKLFILDKMDFETFLVEHTLDESKKFIFNQMKYKTCILKYIPYKVKKMASLHEDKDFVIELIKKDSTNLRDLKTSSVLWNDINFAKDVVRYIPESYISLFPKKIQKLLK